MFWIELRNSCKYFTFEKFFDRIAVTYDIKFCCIFIKSYDTTINIIIIFSQQQISFDEKKKQNISKRTEVKNKDKGDTKAQWQKGKDQDVALRQPQKSVDQTPAPPQVESDASEGKEYAALSQSKECALKKKGFVAPIFNK